jgi:CheY-like chemotaxis protein
MPRKYKIIYIEDSQDDVILFDRALRRSGLDASFEVSHCFDSAEKALDYFLTNSKMAEPDPPPDIILLDLKLPGLSGFDFLSHMRPVQPRPAIGVFTTSILPQDQQKAQAFGVDLFQTKTFDPNEFARFLHFLGRIADGRQPKSKHPR